MNDEPGKYQPSQLSAPSRSERSIGIWPSLAFLMAVVTSNPVPCPADCRAGHGLATFVYPVPMVGAGHASDPARLISPAELIVCESRVEERMR